MAAYSWCTDVHLNFLGDTDARIVEFVNRLIDPNPTGILISGDISVAQQLVYHLSVVERVAQRPVYFVLGNHDYYGSSIDAVRKQMQGLSNMSQYLKYLPITPYVPLTPTTALVGHDGWYDALNGDWQSSRFVMADWTQIHDFIPYGGRAVGMYSSGHTFDKGAIVAHARKLAHEATIHVMQGIKAAARYHKNVIVMTHFPPFSEAHVHQGQRGDSNAQPWYTSKMMGDMLLDAAKSYPNISFMVLAGHTHGKATFKAAKNLVVHVGHAEYNKPQLQNVIDVQ